MEADKEILPLATESVNVTRRRVPTGRVHVHVTPQTHTEDVALSLQEEEVSVERVPVGRFVDQAPTVRTEGDVTIIPVVEERAVVTVRLFLREEVRLRTHRHIRAERHAVTLRSDLVEVERQDITEGELQK